MNAIELYEKENIFIIRHDQPSPLENHNNNEIGVDRETGIFYVPELMIVTYGTHSVITACRNYSQTDK